MQHDTTKHTLRTKKPLTTTAAAAVINFLHGIYIATVFCIHNVCGEQLFDIVATFSTIKSVIVQRIQMNYTTGREHAHS